MVRKCVQHEIPTNNHSVISCMSLRLLLAPRSETRQHGWYGCRRHYRANRREEKMTTQSSKPQRWDSCLHPRLQGCTALTRDVKWNGTLPVIFILFYFCQCNRPAETKMYLQIVVFSIKSNSLILKHGVIDPLDLLVSSLNGSLSFIANEQQCMMLSVQLQAEPTSLGISSGVSKYFSNFLSNKSKSFCFFLSWPL